MSQPKRPYIGGQAVIEGVMMKAPGGVAVALRRPDGQLVIHEEPYVSRFDRGVWKLPGLRGVAALVESLRLGYRMLHFSAEQQMTDEEREAEAAAGSGRWAAAFSVLLALGLFIALPQLLAAGTGKLFGIDFALDDARYHSVMGGFKLLIVFAYIGLLRRVPELRRVFQYHGAEHKTIHAYEAELPLSVENVKGQSTMHPRCGTTFLVVVAVVSVILGTLLAPVLLPAGLEGVAGQAALLALRIAILPLVAAVSFELQRLSARFCTRGPLRVFLLPGFLFQRLSTVEPSEDQIEVAIAAMEAAAWRERHREAEAAEAPRVFESLGGFRAAFDVAPAE